MKPLQELTRGELEEIVQQLLDALYLDYHRGVYTLEKTIDSRADFVHEVGVLLGRFSPVPHE